jgi:chemotaxis protein histidine kinase CheA
MVVRLEHLDKLLNLAGEVIITSSTLHELQRDMVDASVQRRAPTENNLQTIKAADESSRRISQDLHDLVMAIRMVEIGETFKLFRRPVRDLARSLKKEIDLKFEGEKVMVDKALAERLVEPLLHLLRNAADHGLETPIERIHAGKHEKGIVLLRAVEREHETEIVVSDDGRGIDEKAVIERARLLGMIKPTETPNILNILCSSGFSTRQRATDTSGRGVGLDLVRTMVNEFSGTLEMEQTLTQGTTFRMKIPKLKAVNIIDGLIVRCGQSLYALSIDKVVSLQGIRTEEIQASLDRDRFIRYLGEPITLLDLQQLLGAEPSPQEKEGIVPVVVIEGKHSRIAVSVTEFLAPAKLVNVPLDTTMFGADAARGISGTCIISGGRVGMTVDVDELVAIATGEMLTQEEGHEDAQAFSDGDKAASLLDMGMGTQSGSAASSLPDTTLMKHSQEELINKAKLSANRDKIAARLDETGQKDLSGSDVSDLLDELTRGLMELQDSLLSLENQSDDGELMKGAFRRLHAAKGNFAMLGANNPAALAHALETLLDYLRNGRVQMSQDLMDLMLDGVADLIKATKLVPNEEVPENTQVRGRIDAIIRGLQANTAITDPDQLMGSTFTLGPLVELQLLGALKQGSGAYETFLRFKPSRQGDYLVAYLTLRKLCYYGTILASLPTVADMENGNCGGAIKILWATSLDEAKLKATLDELAPLYNITEHQSVPTNVFRYDLDAET